MNFLKGIFSKKVGKHSSKREVIPDVNEETRTMDLRDDPLDLDHKIVREGDPMYDFMMSVMNSEEGVAVANKNSDGMWDVEVR